MKKYGILCAIMLSCASSIVGVGAFEGHESKGGSLWQKPVWPFMPFEVVDRDVVRERYKNEIGERWATITENPSKEKWDGLGPDQKKRTNYIRYKLEHTFGGKADESALPTRDQILIYKYDYKCCLVRPLLRCVHGKPTSYFASILYYGALAALVRKGYKALEKRLQEKPEDKELGGEKHTKLHQNCAWCQARQKLSSKNHTTFKESV